MSPDEGHQFDTTNRNDNGSQSSQGATSEQTKSAGVHITTTSVPGMDEKNNAMGGGVERMSEDDADMQSMHHYPPAPSWHRNEMPYLEEESFTANSDPAASTRSLWAHDLDYREIHGRLYCRDYYMPIDEIEQMRSSLNHQVFLHLLGPESSTVVLESPSHILDVGTGTGEWAIRMAERYPDCEVVGTDIAAVAETSRVPINVFFEIEDAEDWDRPPDCYDLIHFRTMEGAFRDWKALYNHIFYSLKPGGWIEIQDFETESLKKSTEQFRPDSPIHALLADLAVAAEKAGRPRGTKHMNPRSFIDAGFVDVRAMEYAIPITVAEKSAGKIWLVSCLDSIEALCLRLLTEHMDWDPEECKAACEQAARELVGMAKDPEKSKSLVVKLSVVVGRKPLDAPRAAHGQ